MTDQKFNYTPDDICEKMINYLNLDISKSYCEPFSGNHNIFKLLPTNKEYYEIQEFPEGMFEGDKNITLQQKGRTAGKKVGYYFITKKNT